MTEIIIVALLLGGFGWGSGFVAGYALGRLAERKR